MANNRLDFGKHSIWEFKKYKEHEWFRFLLILLILLGIAYIISHFYVDRSAGYEYEKLSKEQLQHINNIYFDSVNVLGTEPILAETRDDSTDSVAVEPEDDKIGSQNISVPRKLIVGSAAYSDCERVLFYIQHQFNNKVDSSQLEGFQPYLCSAHPLEAIGFLGTVRLRVKSYFWLTGPEVYFEIVFWAWFGVICSILFNLGVVGKNSTTDPNNPQTVFDSSEIPYQFAKIFYAPLCTLAIVLGYNYFSDQNVVDISSSKGLIVFAFIGGFYSSRLIAFLDRLKEVVLPSSNTSELPVRKTSAAVILQNISISLELDEATIPADMINEIAEIGLADASVILENDENGEIITALKPEEDQGFIFKINNIKMGRYKIKAAWSKELNEEPVNLEAEQTHEIKNSDSNFTLLLKIAAIEG